MTSVTSFFETGLILRPTTNTLSNNWGYVQSKSSSIILAWREGGREGGRVREREGERERGREGGREGEREGGREEEREGGREGGKEKEKEMYMYMYHVCVVCTLLLHDVHCMKMLRIIIIISPHICMYLLLE